MSVKKEIYLGNGKGKKQKYYYWSEYESFEEAIHYAKKLKKEREPQMKVKHFIIETKEGWFLPIPMFVLYLNKKLRII